MTSKTFTVTGMTCQHCVGSVTKEISELSGVIRVNVNLDNGAVTVESAEPLDSQEVAQAVERAGYTLAS